MKGFAIWTIRSLVVLATIITVSGVFPSQTKSAGLPEGIQEQISIDISPTTPGPNENVTITVRSYSTNLNNSDISWSVNGELIVRNLGATSFTFKTGNVGTQTVVDMTIVKNDGGVIGRKFTIVPAEIDLIFEADTYTPPFYEGRAIFTHESPYHVVAVPNFVSISGRRYSPDELVYTWKIDGRANLSADGSGKNIMYGVGNLISRAFYVTVTAETPDRSIRATRSIFINPYESELFLYEDNPLYGVIYEKALTSSYPMNRNEISVSAVPFFFGVSNPSDVDMKYSWVVGSNSVPLPPNENSLTLIKNEEQAQETVVSVYLNSVGKILQSSASRFTLTIPENE